MSKIAVLGLGAMGSRMAKHLITAGHHLTVYNRTQNKAESLLALGATYANTPKQAVAQADVIFSMLTDDNASRSVWLDSEQGAIHGLSRNSMVIESSTLSPAWIELLATEFARKEVIFTDAPVVGSRPQADAGELIFLVGAQGMHIDLITQILSPMASAIHHIGPVGTGIAMKLAVNALFGTQVCALAETLSMLQGMNIQPLQAIEVLNTLPTTSAALKGAGSLIGASNFSPLFPIKLVKKDFDYYINQVKKLESTTPVIESVRNSFSNAIEQGYGEDNIVAITKLYLSL